MESLLVDGLDNVNLSGNENINNGNIDGKEKQLLKCFKKSFDDFEICRIFYSNLDFFIITNKDKFGNIWMSEKLKETDMGFETNDENEIDYEMKMLIGDRNNEFYDLFANLIIRIIFNNKSYQKDKIMLSICLDKNLIKQGFENFMNSETFKEIISNLKELLLL